MDKPVLKCHACEPPDCSHAYVCENAVMCWKSRNRDSMGVERTSRGCINKRETRSLICNSHRRPSGSKWSSNGNNKNVTDYEFTPSYNTDCCESRDFCNDGDFPDLEVAIVVMKRR